MAKYSEIGELLEGKPREGETKGSLYIKIKEDVKLTKGMNISLEDPKAKYQRMLNSGKLSDTAADEVQAKIEKIPKFVKKILILRTEE